LCCRYVANVSFLFFWKRTGSRREKEKALNLVFFFSCPSLNLVFLFPHWIWERERDTHTHTYMFVLVPFCDVDTLAIVHMRV
jgi:hypothetical protein